MHIPKWDWPVAHQFKYQRWLVEIYLEKLSQI